jgi:large subunit ribosomal protein L9
MGKTQIILLQKLHNHHIGDIINVAAGYARNFLLPQRKAMLATDENCAIVAAKKAELELQYQALKVAAYDKAEKITDLSIQLLRQAADDDSLYGSVTIRDIVDAIYNLTNVEIEPDMVHMSGKIKKLGTYNDVVINLHADVAVPIEIIVIKQEN